MPITQNRMLALLDAAQDYQHGWKRAQAFYLGIREAVAQQRMTQDAGWEQLETLLNSTLQLRTPIQTTETLTRETTHFRLTRKRNEDAARWAREKREGRPPKAQKRTKEQRKHSLENENRFQNTDHLQVQSDSELVFDEAPAVETEIATGYIPKELDPDTKARIEQETRLRHEQERFVQENGIGAEQGKR